MKKKPEQPLSLITLTGTAVFSTKRYNKKKRFKCPLPPSEETLLRLNAIAKDAPFCFHFPARENDFL